MKQKLNVTWNDYGIYLEDLCMQIEREGKIYKRVYGHARGGLIMAVAISHYFDIPMTSLPKSEDLVVDDIADSGNTLKQLMLDVFGKDESKYADVATMFLRNNCTYQPLYWCKKVNDLWWVDFPYEYSDRPDTLSKVINS